MRRRSTFMLLLGGLAASAGVVAASACSYDWTFTPDSGVFASDGSPQRPSDAEVPKPLPPDVIEPVGTCKSSSDCPSGAFCKFSDEQCGRFEPLGKCALIKDCVPEPPSPAPVICACSGGAVESACAAADLRLDVDRKAESCVPGDHFRCADVIGGCTRKSQYCLVTSNERTGKCVDIECPEVTCAACPALNQPPCACTDKDPGAIELVCP